MSGSSVIYNERADYSKTRLTNLSDRLADLKDLQNYPGLTIFAAGSYGRLEASTYSDIDLFFLAGKQSNAVTEPRTKSLRIFGKVIEIGDDMGFQKFSNDSEYLVILPIRDMLEQLGGRRDDHENYFTARMRWEHRGMEVIQGDYLHMERLPLRTLILANPPYLRHQGMTKAYKRDLRERASIVMGKK